MKKYTFNFEASMMGYFLYTLLWGLVIVLSAGLAIPFFVIWQVKYFASRLTILENKQEKEDK